MAVCTLHSNTCLFYCHSVYSSYFLVKKKKTGCLPGTGLHRINIFYLIIKQMSIVADGNVINANAQSLQNYFIDNTPDLITAINGTLENNFYKNPDGTYSCEYKNYHVQHGIGLPRSGNCGNLLSKEGVVDKINVLFPIQNGGKRRRSRSIKNRSRKNRSRKNRSRKNRSRKN